MFDAGCSRGSLHLVSSLCWQLSSQRDQDRCLIQPGISHMEMQQMQSSSST